MEAEAGQASQGWDTGRWCPPDFSWTTQQLPPAASCPRGGCERGRLLPGFSGQPCPGGRDTAEPGAGRGPRCQLRSWFEAESQMLPLAREGALQAASADVNRSRLTKEFQVRKSPGDSRGTLAAVQCVFSCFLQTSPDDQGAAVPHVNLKLRHFSVCWALQDPPHVPHSILHLLSHLSTMPRKHGPSDSSQCYLQT